MRSLRSATWTSGDPVSPSCFLYVLMTSDLRSLVNATASSTHGPDSVAGSLSHQTAVCWLMTRHPSAHEARARGPALRIVMTIGGQDAACPSGPWGQPARLQLTKSQFQLT